MWWPFSGEDTTKKEEPSKEEEPEVPAASPAPIEQLPKTIDGVAFTAKKCPPNPDLESSCELPYGFVWTPTAPNKNLAVIDCEGESLPPVLCLTCLAYINSHAQVNYETGIWTCPLCDNENIAPTEDLKNLLEPALTNNMVEYHQTLKSSDTADDDTRTLVLVVDTNLTGDDGRGVADALEQFIRVSKKKEHFPKTRIGLVVFDQVVSMYQLGLLGIASADVYTPIDPDDDEALIRRKNVMEERAFLKDVNSVEDLESLKRCLSATFGVALDRITEGDEEAVSRIEILKRRKEERLRNERNGKSGAQKQDSESPWVKHRREAKIKQPKRCVGEAIQCAIDLTVVGHPNPSRTSQILVFTNGCPNTGGGSIAADEDKENNNIKRAHDVVDTANLEKAIEYFDTTANFALETGVGIDVFCSGVNELGLPAYQALVEPSGGYVLSHFSLNSVQLKRNLNFVLQSTYTSRWPVAELDGEQNDDPQVFLDIRTDSFMTPSSLNGPGELIADDTDMLENERSAFASGASLAIDADFDTDGLPLEAALDVSMTRITLGRVDPRSTVAVSLELNDTFEEGTDTQCFFQFISRYLDRQGKKCITRVYTYRFPVASDVTDFVNSASSEVVAVVLAKTAVYRTLHGREETDQLRDKVTAGDTETLEQLAHETQLDIDATVQRISGAFRLLDLESSGTARKQSSASSLDSAFPSHLTNALKLLYCLRRGPLISPGPMRSMDDRAALRGIFLRFPLSECISMMGPKLWSTGLLEKDRLQADIEAMPAETLALWDNVSEGAMQFSSLQKPYLTRLVPSQSWLPTTMTVCTCGQVNSADSPTLTKFEKSASNFFCSVQRIGSRCRS